MAAFPPGGSIWGISGDITHLTNRAGAKCRTRMMPWEHAMLAYIGYSVLLRFGRFGPPTSVETATIVFGSLLPDIVDKPLAWQYNLFLSGHAIGHSVFVAVPVSVAVLLFAWRRGRPRVGVAFATGYLLHLPGDVVPQSIRGDELLIDRVLWPVRRSGSGYDSGFGAELRENLTEYAGWILEQLSSGEPDPYVFVVLGIPAAGFLLWVADGMPLGRELYAALRNAIRSHDG